MLSPIGGSSLIIHDIKSSLVTGHLRHQTRRELETPAQIDIIFWDVASWKDYFINLIRTQGNTHNAVQYSEAI